MAILKKVTHEGNKYNLGTIERVAAETAHQSIDPKPNQNGIQRVTTDAATTITATDTLIDFAVDAGSSRVVTMPAAVAGRKIRCVWSVEQATSDRVFTRAGSDTFYGNITTLVEGNAGGDGDVVVVAGTTVAITCVDDVNLGSYLDFDCAVDGAWFVTGILILDGVGLVPTLA